MNTIIRPKRGKCRQCRRPCLKHSRYSPAGPLCTHCRALKSQGGGRPISTAGKRNLRRLVAASWEEEHPGKRLTGRRWVRIRRQMSREERAFRRAVTK